MQNKPNPLKPKTNTTSYATWIYTNIPPRSARKNKPNQTQLVPAKPRANPVLSTVEGPDLPHMDSPISFSLINYNCEEIRVRASNCLVAPYNVVEPFLD